MKKVLKFKNDIEVWQGQNCIKLKVKVNQWCNYKKSEDEGPN